MSPCREVEPNTPRVRVLATQVTVAGGTLLLSQAAGPPVEVTNTRLTISWELTTPATPPQIQVTGDLHATDLGLRPFRARHRPLDDLDGTNPGVAAALRAAVPAAPWDA